MEPSIDTIAREVESCLLRLVPDWTEFGVVLSSRIGGKLADPWNYFGFWNPSLDQVYRVHLPHLCGRAPAVVLNDVHAQREVKLKFWTVYRQLVAYALHETAHALDYGPPYYGEFLDNASPETLERTRTHFSELMTDPPECDLDEPPYAGHEAGFIRMACHLRYRAARIADEHFCITQIIAPYRYWMTHPRDFEAALRNEPARMVNWPFARILEHPPPEAFTRLWESEVKCWNETLVRRKNNDYNNARKNRIGEKEKGRGPQARVSHAGR